jgi:glutamate N-acetyltransferase/amino-acid N-acetyltransferase
MQQLDNGSVTSPAGFRAGSVAAEIKYPDRPDLTLVVSERPCPAAGVFTQNQVAAAPVLVSRANLEAERTAIRAVAANAGNANACTGEQGLADARAMAEEAAAVLDCAPEQVLLLSTGVIGVPLPMEKIRSGVKRAAQILTPDGGALAARAIMTTDTHPKQMALRVELSGGPVTIGGMAKGAGMIHPNMATMLGLLTTDAVIPVDILEGMLATAVSQSFNRISVDGDTSTNDTVFLLANGASGVAAQTAADQEKVGEAITAVCVALAQMIVRDGEGATKFVTLRVTGAASPAAAHRVAETIATSPLVKTAFAGGDANWGRILAAAGRAGVAFDQTRTGLWIAAPDEKPLQLVAKGTPTAYAEADAARIFAEAEIEVTLQIGDGSGDATMWTTDLTHDYVTINADYRT